MVYILGLSGSTKAVSLKKSPAREDPTPLKNLGFGRGGGVPINLSFKKKRGIRGLENKKKWEGGSERTLWIWVGRGVFPGIF